MKQLKIKLLIALGLLMAQQATGQTNIYELQVEGQKLLYRVILPDNYEVQGSYPVLFVPGLEKESDDYSVYLGNSPSQFDWIIVESIVHMKADFLTKTLIERVKKDYQVRSLYLSGFSANSINIFRNAAKYIEMIDGIVAMPGYANNIDKNVISRNPDVKIVLIVGEKDTHWKLKSMGAYKDLTALGSDVFFEVIPGEGHIMRRYAGNPFFTYLTKTLLMDDDH